MKLAGSSLFSSNFWPFWKDFEWNSPISVDFLPIFCRLFWKNCNWCYWTDSKRQFWHNPFISFIGPTFGAFWQLIPTFQLMGTEKKPNSVEIWWIIGARRGKWLKNRWVNWSHHCRHRHPKSWLEPKKKKAIKKIWTSFNWIDGEKWLKLVQNSTRNWL